MSTAVGDAGQITLSACIMTLDEEEAIGDCLASVAFCDEVIVVDSGSRDRTCTIARETGARVVENPWPGFAAQRNVAIDHARGRWILEVDADERVTPELAREIVAFVADPPSDVHLAGLPIRHLLVGHRLGPSAKYPNYRHRLFEAAHHRHDEGVTVHEGLIPDGRVHAFAGELTHLLATSWPGFAREALAYARLDAAQLAAARTARARVNGAVVRPLVKLGWRTVVDGGWRDGWPGLAMITRDCAYDSIVWLSPTPGEVRERVPGVGSGHFGSRRWPRGEPHVAVVAYGRAAAAAERWCERARAGGIDATLICDVASASAVPQRRTSRVSPLSLIRAIDAEEQLRTVDAVLHVGTHARLACRLLPGAQYGLRAPTPVPADLRVLRDEILAARGAQAP